LSWVVSSLLQTAVASDLATVVAIPVSVENEEVDVESSAHLVSACSLGVLTASIKTHAGEYRTVPCGEVLGAVIELELIGPPRGRSAARATGFLENGDPMALVLQGSSSG
jgi:hypothetical protein